MWHHILIISSSACPKSASVVWSPSSSVPPWSGTPVSRRAASVRGPTRPFEPPASASRCTPHPPNCGLGLQRRVRAAVAAPPPLTLWTDNIWYFEAEGPGCRVIRGQDSPQQRPAEDYSTGTERLNSILNSPPTHRLSEALDWDQPLQTDPVCWLTLLGSWLNCTSISYIFSDLSSVQCRWTVLTLKKNCV